MITKQLSVFIENKPGRLSEITAMLAELDINMHALSIADTTDYGILRMIVDNPEQALEKLRNAGLTVTSNDVLSVKVNNTPGGLTSLLKTLSDSGFAIEYVYAFADSVTSARAVIRTDNATLAEKVIKEHDSTAS